ncbi:MAG: hypothetical protein O2816_16560 [Planctomycetota bacterium]|nr:hypothetical protein [Planctomycetota bacterium]
MSQPQGQSRVCPTRTDDRPVLFAHKVSKSQCQDRQRGSYHKCFSCVHNNSWAASTGKDPRVARAAPTGTAEKRPEGPEKSELVAAAAAPRVGD